MTDHRYVPRDFLIQPELFGEPGVAVRWHPKPAAAPEIDWFLASAIQHSFAARMRAAVKQSDRYSSVRDFAKQEGFRYAGLTEVLRGSGVMRLDHIAAARRTLGIDLNVWGPVLIGGES